MSFAIDLGLAGTEPASLDLVELLATRLLVQGNSGSGKSHLLRRLLEQSAGLVQQAVIDPEGDFVSLAERYGHVVVEADGDEGALARIAARVREHRVSVVLSLEALDAEGQMRAAAAFLNGLFEADRSRCGTRCSSWSTRRSCSPLPWPASIPRRRGACRSAP